MLEPGREQAEDVSEVDPRLNVAEPPAGQQRGERRVPGASVVVADEQSVLSTYGDDAQRGFGGVAVRRDLRVVAKAREFGPRPWPNSSENASGIPGRFRAPRRARSRRAGEQ
jgi:hypothetical protein